MIQRRAATAGIKTRIGNHTFRATGITAYLKNNGTLETAQHSSTTGGRMKFHWTRSRRFRFEDSPACF
jgi:hypothetical protein